MRLLHDVASGMAYLHAKGVIHGDLKSVNIMVDHGKAMIADFGLSRVRQQMTTAGGWSSSAAAGGIAGTPAFIAPEVLSGQLPRAPADVYAFGMVCFEVLSGGHYPFEGMPNIPAIIYKVAVLRERPARPEGVSDGIWALMNDCWEFDAANRPGFGVLRDRLGTLLD